ncbi:MAG: YaiO family outer membrane beta-barrel protein [Gemmatimonadaceae bacterium]|nr:YaiO family outer membrane beta-barrel protein [Gemmatimonadaceae bacterium]
MPSTNAFAADFTYVSFRGDVDPWRLGSIGLARSTPVGSLVGRLNWANRFAKSGTQLEADVYPRINDRMYAYLNAGYSASSIFPAWRFGGELFSTLPDAWEASLGFRQLLAGDSLHRGRRQVRWQLLDFPAPVRALQAIRRVGFRRAHDAKVFRGR